MFSTRSLRLLALGALLSVSALGGPIMRNDASAQIILKQTRTDFAPRISQRELQRMRDEERVRDQRIRERKAAQRRFAEENRRILERQRVGRSQLFGSGRSGTRSSSRGGSAVSR
jgi:hypothetical protein